jgi:hypothetical protein
MITGDRERRDRDEAMAPSSTVTAAAPTNGSAGSWVNAPANGPGRSI